MSKYLYGVHDLGAWADMVQQAGVTAWVVHTEAIGADSNDQTGKDYRHPFLTPIVRLNYAYGEGHGTIPAPDRYAAFAQRCANFVANSQGIEYVVIGNEIALPWEWPEAGKPLTLTTYADCYRQCYDAIKRVAPDVKIAPQAPAPWNASVPDAPDWIMQLPAMLNMLSSRIDWICLHAYTRGYSPESFASGARMNPPYLHRYAGWETLWEYMGVIPQAFRHLPVMVTEVNGNASWPASNTGWITAMYDQIDDWNAQPGNQQIRAACLFRWLPEDRQWSLAHSPGAADDLRNALRQGYQWREPEAPRLTTKFTSGDWAKVVVSTLNVRNAPALQADVALKLSAGDTFAVDMVYSGDGLIWLHGPHGWAAEVAPDGTRLIEQTEAPSVATDRDAVVRRLAGQYGVDERLALAVIAIESGGAGFRNGELVTRFEPHVFLARFQALFRQYFQVGEPQWDGNQHRVNNGGAWLSFHGDQVYERVALGLAAEIGRMAAFESASYGAGQIMGFNYATCGYNSAEAMVAAFRESEEAQIRAMFEYFRNRKDDKGRSCLDCLRDGDMVGFAALYNGPGQAEHYAGLIRQRAGL